MSFISVMSAVLQDHCISALNIASRDGGLSLGRDRNNTALTCASDSLLTSPVLPRCKDAPLRLRQRHVPALRSGPDAKTAAYIRAVATQRERASEHTGKRSRAPETSGATHAGRDGKSRLVTTTRKLQPIATEEGGRGRGIGLPGFC